MTRQAKTPDVASARPHRTPLGTRNRVSVKHKDDGYHYRTVNCNLERDPERVQDFLDQGYEIVSKQESGPIGDKRVDNSTAPGSVGEFSVGQGTKAVLMRIRKDWYDEDQRAKQQLVDDSEQTVKRENADYGSVAVTR